MTDQNSKGREKYISMPQIARILNCSTRKARRWLTRERAAVKKGRHYYTTERLMMLHFPEAFHAAALDEDH